ncbi:MAG: AMP-binding protein [Dehalococcoidia bacterium]|nr:AMP-binding protein [Dehalococcoidia bacterium]
MLGGQPANGVANRQWDARDLPPDAFRPLVRKLLTRPWRTVVVDDYRAYRGIHLYAGAVHLAGEIERLTKQPRVGLMLPTSGMFPLGLLATWFTGRTAVPVNYLLKQQERDYVIADAGLDLVITARQMLKQFGDLPPGVQPLFLEEVTFPKLPRFRRPVTPDPNEVAALIYTSGTSGRPKGVELTHRNLGAVAWQCRQWGEVTPRDVFLGVLPQFHSFGLSVLTLLPLTTGAKVVYTARFVPSKIVELMRRHRPTGFVGIPAMYKALLADKTATKADFTSLRLLICGGEPLAPAVRESVESRFGITINEGYGLTETSAVTNWARPEDTGLHSVGRAIPLVEQVILDPAGGELPPGEEGEICVRGPNLMRGYHNLPESTAAVFDARGFFHTGDLGKLDVAGRLYITGRLSDLIIVGGENVFPREIEDVLNRHASVKDAAVIGMAHGARGEVPVAFVELQEGADLEESRLRAYCREQLAGYKVPRRIVALEELPRTSTGKILKRDLPLDLMKREPAATTADSDAD